MGARESLRRAEARSRARRSRRKNRNGRHARPLSPRRARRNRRRKFGSGAPRRIRRTRADGVEDGAIHGKPSRRGIRCSDYFRAEVRIFRGARRNLRRRPGQHRSPRGNHRPALHLSRARSHHRRRTAPPRTKQRSKTISPGRSGQGARRAHRSFPTSRGVFARLVSRRRLFSARRLLYLAGCLGGALWRLANARIAWPLSRQEKLRRSQTTSSAPAAAIRSASPFLAGTFLHLLAWAWARWSGRLHPITTPEIPARSIGCSPSFTRTWRSAL